MNYLLDFLYPTRCPGCDRVISAEEAACAECCQKMLIDHNAYCHLCGKPRCICGHKELDYDRAVAACRYTEEASSAVIRMKTSVNTGMARFSAQIIAQRLADSIEYPVPDCIMPVPMHPSKIRERGYNQAALIGKEIALLMHIPYREDVLYKEKTQYAQHELTHQQRADNVSCFGANQICIDGMTILLCDDVLTTGNTMSRCAALLKQQGAKLVIAAAAATTALKEESK